MTVPELSMPIATRSSPWSDERHVRTESRQRIGMNAHVALKEPATVVALAQPQSTIVVRRIPFAKRTLDVLLSGSGLIASAPLLAVIAVMVKLEDGGLVCFGQDR